MGTSSPVVYDGRAYIGVSGAGRFAAYSGRSIHVLDLMTKSIAYTVQAQDCPRTSGGYGSSDILATEQAFCALAALQLAQEGRSLFRMRSSQ